MLSTDTVKSKSQKKKYFEHIKINDPVEESLKITVPSWPLQNTVAVNPFWEQRHKPFTEVLKNLAPIFHNEMYMPLAYFLEKYRKGLIHETALEKALETAQSRLGSTPKNMDELLKLSEIEQTHTYTYLSYSEFLDENLGSSWRHVIDEQISKYASAYFDKSQSLTKFPWSGESFWDAWNEAVKHDKSMEIYGIKKFKKYLQGPKDLSGLSSKEFINACIKSLGISHSHIETIYLSRLLARVFGWASQFRYVTWQKNLGYNPSSSAEITDLLAVSLAYDYALAQYGRELEPSMIEKWLGSLAEIHSHNDRKSDPFTLYEIWQNASEISYQQDTAKLIQPSKVAEVAPKFQVVMCIDVRSEILKRALEKTSAQVETIGFAGFFGVPFSYRKASEKSAGNRLPVLLSPAYTVKEESKDPTDVKLTTRTFVQSFFRLMRKAPLSSLLYVELFGIFSLVRMIRSFIDNLIPRPVSRSVPLKYTSIKQYPSSKLQAFQGHQHHVSHAEKVERSFAVLKHMGLTKRFGKTVFITGHGSVNTNNAFNSAYDCGACGGHAGDINARVLANLLNNREIRAGLGDKGIVIPSDTHFVAAIHETVTDEIYILDEQEIPDTHLQEIKEFKAISHTAGEVARNERNFVRSNLIDLHAGRRVRNWSEVRPEWGLAGNASFIVAPREWTKKANLGGRSFLHDYNWKEDTEFKTLELIMTAPMVVTNWINLQYYGSTVAPKVYGSGNKVIHNVVNESGVQEGNGGDLRVGLPWQSVHDGERFIHEPLRLSVFLAAPREEIEKIIANHLVVKQLVDHEWLYILHINEETGVITRRAPGGLYLPV